ncbi:hypothetical protein [Pseudoclavibacter sp. VKM Ac-2867]|uniref:hypothetical protein n=1 Tax=Pseudoclavibacter sp. VKM Ac-2867 TaxID=2783829 RepID=UPI00188AAEE2|nr:hypothetical protein [Pseudoclavibacter sp. VKM Ac-2867]MBF4457862.1 hypothetical protein [Pseudoclavibacter sp. VKM Ac-2867]
MRPRRFIPAVMVPLALAALVGCSPTAPAEREPPKFELSINEVRDASKEVAEGMVAEFPEATRLVEADPNVFACSGEEPGIGRWVWATTFSSTDLASTITQLQQEYGDAVTSTGTASETVEYADGSTWPATGAHTLIEEETGSYLLSYPAGTEGQVLLRVVTACGVVR